MGVRIDWDAVPDYSTLPHDLYDVVIPTDGVKLEFSRTGKLMAVVTYQVVAPPELAGRETRSWHVLGTDEDKEGQDPSHVIKSPGIRTIKRLLKATGQPLDPDIEVACGSLLGQQLTILVTLEQDEQGRPVNRVSQMFPVGEQIPGSLSHDAAANLPGGNGAAGAPRPTTPAPTAPQAAPVAPPQPAAPAPPPQEGAVPTARPLVARPVRPQS